MPDSHVSSIPLSLIIVRNPFLDFAHLRFLIDALNRQSLRAFNTYWVDQSSQPQELATELAQTAAFPWLHVPVHSPLVAGVTCWELTSVFAALVAHQEMGEAFSYLHMECLPAVDFVASIAAVLPGLRAAYGSRWIAMGEQLWTNLSVADLFADVYWDQLRISELRQWAITYLPHLVYQPGIHPPYVWEAAPHWRENAFVMPAALARETGLYAAVERPLYFQDVFDIFTYVQERPYWRDIRWVHLPGSVIYHLHHPRPFGEFSQAFLQAIRAHPELFAGLAIHDAIDWRDEAYSETEAMRRGFVYTDELNRFYQRFRHAPEGTNHHWLRALDRFHDYEPIEPFRSRF